MRRKGLPLSVSYDDKEFSEHGRTLIELSYHKIVERTPKIIPIAAGFAFFATAIALITGTALLYPGPYAVRLWNLNRPAYLQFQKLGLAGPLFLYIVGVISCVTAFGLLRRRRWAWWLAILTFAVNILGDLVSLVVTRDWIKTAAGLIVSATFLFFLARRGVRSSLD